MGRRGGEAAVGGRKMTTERSSFFLAERARFELAVSCPTLVFKTSTLNHSVTSPGFPILTEVETGIKRLRRWYRRPRRQ